MPRYAQASQGQYSFGIEGTPYSEASDLTSVFGLIREDSTPPNPNPQTPMGSTGARRGPHVNSPDPREYDWSIPFQPVDHQAPYEVALGSRATTPMDPDSDSTDEYNEHLITEADRLPTMTVAHGQGDLGSAFLEKFIGAKASLSLSASQGEPVSGELDVIAANRTYNDSATLPSITIPELTPFRFWMAGDMALTDPSDGSTVKNVATIGSFDFSWDNGLEAQHHGSSYDSREAYAVAETTGEGKYDMSVSVTIEDLDLYKRAADNSAEVDVEIPLIRGEDGSGNVIDAMYIRLLGCEITSSPIPNATEGSLVPDVELSPTNTEIEIREPLV